MNLTLSRQATYLSANIFKQGSSATMSATVFQSTRRFADRSSPRISYICVGQCEESMRIQSKRYLDKYDEFHQGYHYMQPFCCRDLPPEDDLGHEVCF